MSDNAKRSKRARRVAKHGPRHFGLEPGNPFNCVSEAQAEALRVLLDSDDGLGYDAFSERLGYNRSTIKAKSRDLVADDLAVIDEAESEQGKPKKIIRPDFSTDVVVEMREWLDSEAERKNTRGVAE